jgi:hypothetical protein
VRKKLAKRKLAGIQSSVTSHHSMAGCQRLAERTMNSTA